MDAPPRSRARGFGRGTFVAGKRTHRGKTQYLVKYKGYKLLKDCEWRPETELKKTAPELLAEFTTELKKSNIASRRLASW